MYRVIYTSQASQLFGRAALSAVTAVSRRNNARLDVSGLLVCHDRRFFQVLEGTEMVLTALMTRIAADPRHQNLAMVAHGPTQQRAFTTWRVYCASKDPLATLDPQISALERLIPTNSELRGNDPNVRQHVRAFLAGLRNLPAAHAA
ncbi:BLUF domain-containing protein [Rhodobacteraceae bacterium N5(2021)]|uniref:BLUF domain-containing protein n=1 Tax=Gymnodinialimonas phycosphaerae TaxID=2841589 RepID=A0A975TXP2_9RHOB|nr:BLUF domain-containing protein [Gymnodinialimonas phycosphaerae]MBY4892632.1 BLUF domain-containing protein [Gymnodinialimonas phycosphaerae]